MVEGIEPALEPGRQPEEPFATEPELELDRLVGPGFGNITGGRESHRRLHYRPEVSDGDRGVWPSLGGERPVRNGVLAGITPGAQLFQAPTQFARDGARRTGSLRVMGYSVMGDRVAGWLGSRVADNVLVTRPLGHREHSEQPPVSVASNYPSPITLDLT